MSAKFCNVQILLTYRLEEQVYDAEKEMNRLQELYISRLEELHVHIHELDQAVTKGQSSKAEKLRQVRKTYSNIP